MNTEWPKTMNSTELSNLYVISPKTFRKWLKSHKGETVEPVSMVYEYLNAKSSLPNLKNLENRTI